MTAPGAGIALRPPQSALRAVASLGIRPIVSGPVRTGRILGGSNHVAWVATSDGVIVLTGGEGPRLPNGVEVISSGSKTEMGGLAPSGSSVAVGDGVIKAEVSIVVSRWWDPSPRVGVAAAAEIAARIEGLPDAIDAVDGRELASAVESGQADAILAAAARILGRGDGLTPEADDYLAGVLASVRAVGPAVGDRQAGVLLDAIADPMHRMAMARTTSLSASLLRHAVRGEVAAPAGAFLRAACGRGDVGSAHRSALDIGHSSGPALAAGMVLGLRTVVERASRRTGGVRR